MVANGKWLRTVMWLLKDGSTYTCILFCLCTKCKSQARLNVSSMSSLLCAEEETEKSTIVNPESDDEDED